MSRRILVLDGDCGAAISVVQSLGRAGYHVTLAATSFAHRAFRSRYASDRARCPSPLADKAAFQTWVLAQRDYALVIPVTELSLMPLHEIRDRPELLGRVALPPADATTIGFDKERVRLLAEQIGIPVPATRIASSPIDLDAPVFDAWLEQGAVVLKSIRSKVWADGVGKELAVQMAVNREQLAIMAAQMFESGSIQLQQWVPGTGRGIEVLVDKGEIVLSYAHERIHELPLTGGGSCYRRGLEPPQDLLEASQRLLRTLGWHGVAMVEFRHDAATGRWFMMELNGRFWGSLPLAQFAGVDFPLALVELLLDNKRPVAVTARPVYARSFGRDIQWLKQVARMRLSDLVRRDAPSPERKLMLLRPLLRSVLEWGRLLTGRETLDGAALDDPGPIWWEVRKQIAEAAGAPFRKWRQRHIRREAVAAWQKPLVNVHRIMVLCSGNVCRSAYAGVRLGKALGAGFEVRSGGLSGSSGMRSPAVFAAAARNRGIDLTGHRSHAVDDAGLDWADLVLVMENKHAEALAVRRPEVLSKTRWLGGATARRGENPAIVDPVDFTGAQMETVLDLLDRATDAVAERLQLNEGPIGP